MRVIGRKILRALQLSDAIDRVISLIKTPVFWLLTIGGNSFVLAGAFLMQWIEGSTNTAAENYIDCVAWAVGIVTTVGAGSIQPTTIAGKSLMIVMMIGGAVFLWAYMALFIGALVGPELKMIEREVTELQKSSKQEDDVLAQMREIIERAERSRQGPKIK